MFDTTKELSLNVVTPDGDKEAIVRFPTDEQLIDRVQKMKTIVRSLGNGKSQTEPLANETNDARLFAAIKVSGADLDEFEASQVISRLTKSKVEDSSREGNQFKVTLKVPGAKTIHTLRIPSAKQVYKYTRSVVSVIELRHGASEMKLNLRASADLYDSLIISSEGYAGAVPVTHKSDVISEIISVLNQDKDDEDIAGF